MPNIWIFEDTKLAYDASQTSEVIKDGDILVATKERVVGFLYKAWPVAVTGNSDDEKSSGEFHRAKDDDYAGLNDDRAPGSTVDYVESAKLAQGEAARLACLETPWSATDTDLEVLYPELQEDLLRASLPPQDITLNDLIEDQLALAEELGEDGELPDEEPTKET